MYVNSQKSNNNAIFEGKKTKGYKQDSQNNLKLPMPEKDCSRRDNGIYLSKTQASLPSW